MLYGALKKYIKKLSGSTRYKMCAVSSKCNLRLNRQKENFRKLSKLLFRKKIINST